MCQPREIFFEHFSANPNGHNSSLCNIQPFTNKHRGSYKSQWYILNISRNFKNKFDNTKSILAFYKNTFKQIIGTNIVEKNEKTLKNKTLMKGIFTPCCKT